MNENYSKPNQPFNNDEQRHTVNPRRVLDFLIKEVIMDSRVCTVVIHNEESKSHCMDLTEDEQLERIFFPKNADELARIFEMHERRMQND